MSKYKVLFHESSIEPEDDSIKIGSNMLFGYTEQWTFDSFEAAYKEAIDNDYRPTEFTIVKVVEYEVKEL